MTETRLVAHLDCDAFFYSVECLRDPSLIGKAVIISGSSPRAVVTTASYEARKYGVGSAMPASRARRLCPQAIVVPPDGPAYRQKSQEVWAFVKESLGCEIQQASVDEAYVELTGTENPIERLRELVMAVKDECGIMISVGVGPSRLVAKVASDADKPEGFLVLSREGAVERFAPSPVRLLPGIGPKTAERLLDIGIVTVGHLQNSSEVALTERFGLRYGKELKARAYFHDDSPVEVSRVRKSTSHEHTFDQDISDMDELLATIRDLARRLSEDLRKNGKRGRTIGIKVRLDDWTTATRDRSISSFTDEEEVIQEVAQELLTEYDPQRPVRLLGVRMASFEDVVGPPPPPKAPKPPNPPSRRKILWEQLKIPQLAHWRE